MSGKKRTYDNANSDNEPFSTIHKRQRKRQRKKVAECLSAYLFRDNSRCFRSRLPYLKERICNKMDAGQIKLNTEHKSLQQEDNHRKLFFDKITKGGLQYVYEFRKGISDPQKNGTTSKEKHVIIVGAGISGLVAAYELEQAGHKTTIIELTNRVGGRVKTVHEFPKGLHAEGGAMRIPPSHFLTWHYLKLFKIKMRPFKNKNPKGFLYLFGNKITLEDWEKDNGKWTNAFWPGWDANLSPEMKENGISGILDLYRETVRPVKEELIKDHSEEGWDKWTNKWSKLSMLEFFRSDQYQAKNEPRLRPWTEAAILAYKMSGYNIILDQSMVEYLRDELGGWWQEELYTPEDGMSALLEAFIGPNKYGWNKNVELLNQINFGIRVQEVELMDTNDQVKVTGTNTQSGEHVCYQGDAVILALPLTILRQLKLPLEPKQQMALADITYEASTKVLLQFRKRFWQDSVGQGGFTITDRPIGQIKYPGWDGSPYTKDDRGILVSYTWGQDALTLGAQTSDQAVASALQEVCKIHPEAKQYFEHGVVQAWSSDPASQGAFACIRPFEYINNKDVLTNPIHPVYLAGDAISWANGWIQGALMSGLYVAYKFYKYNEDDAPCKKREDQQIVNEDNATSSTKRRTEQPIVIKDNAQSNKRKRQQIDNEDEALSSTKKIKGSK
ncbi:hypothetical protein CHS0354_012244 [Potamilus streckersoni]|uniref:Amine oxidase domain-containing protein n=1 Tax=Potamilus streckersoni TaxID=2493646 RepID=A0AAE0VT49_9BIVA|nr:hypothetical protein CHS0354_012244 [Potamilus streckersoni]